MIKSKKKKETVRYQLHITSVHFFFFNSNYAAIFDQVQVIVLFNFTFNFFFYKILTYISIYCVILFFFLFKVYCTFNIYEIEYIQGVIFLYLIPNRFFFFFNNLIKVIELIYSSAYAIIYNRNTLINLKSNLIYIIY